MTVTYVVINETTGRVIRECGEDRVLAERLAARLPELAVRTKTEETA